ncbi:MAG: RnfABCDGE type electron transport complex subunit G [Ruminococcaceae bacterium]|nr:RnfABCDGE type electron transport complex subunit G [Oscillospiraceae bacterium]
MSKFIGFLKSNVNDIFKPILVLFAICIVIPLALSLTNELTAERIIKLQGKNEKATMSKLIKADEFEEYTFTGKKENFDLYIATEDGDVKGYIFKTSAKGYGGEVSVMTAIDTNGKVKEVSILDASNETPGLGQNVTKENFYSQFMKKIKDITVVKNSAIDENNEVNAVTGATISSKAVTSAVNKALANFEEYSNAIFKDTEVEYSEE